MFDFLSSTEAWLSLFTLIVMEVILGIDNIIFISIIADRLAKDKRQHARIIGLSLALIIRIGLLFSISWLVHLTNPLITIEEFELSARDIILMGGGFFLLYKTTREIHNHLETGEEEEHHATKGRATMRDVITQIILIDVVFSVDSILTAVGLVDHVEIMIIAVTVAMIFMIF